MDNHLLSTQSDETSEEKGFPNEEAVILKHRSLYNILMQVPAMICVVKGPDHIFELANKPYLQLIGNRDPIGKPLREAIPEIVGQGFIEILDKVFATGKSFNGKEIPVFIETENGKREQFFLNFNYQAIYDDSHHHIQGIMVFAYDVTEQVSAREQMKRVAEMIEKLYMNAPAFICTLKGPEYIFELVNPEYQKLYGKRRLLGKKLIKAIPELKGQGIMEKLNAVYQTGEPYVVTELLLYLARDEGREPEATYLNFSYQAMYDSDKKINGVLVFGYEVTEQVLAKKKGEENLKKILESLPQITSASSADGTNIFFNKFFFKYSGLSKEEATTHGWNSIVHPDEVDDVLSLWEKCKEKEEDFYKEIRFKRKSDGVYRWHIAHITPMKNKKGEITQWIASATDIHEQKNKEQKKDEFISIASHEMKTPLTTAKAYLQLLEASLDKNNEKANLYTKKAILSINRLKDLIAELLDVSKIQHGKLLYNFTYFDFDAMLHETVENFQHNSVNHQIEITGGIPVLMKGDSDRLQQVLINLLSNATKYSPNPGKIFVTSSVDNKEIKVSVQDHGIGIAKDNLENIFDRYFRIEGQEILFQGLGIGLFISMEIIKRHNGKLWAESEPGEGSTFYFTLPLNIEN